MLLHLLRVLAEDQNSVVLLNRRKTHAFFVFPSFVVGHFLGLVAGLDILAGHSDEEDSEQ